MGAEGELLRDEPAAPEVTSSETVFEGAVWNVVRDPVDYNGSPMVREYVAHTGAVAVLAVDDQDRVLVIQQYRHPIRSRDWELPAGLLPDPGFGAGFRVRPGRRRLVRITAAAAHRRRRLHDGVERRGIGREDGVRQPRRRPHPRAPAGPLARKQQRHPRRRAGSRVVLAGR